MAESPKADGKTPDRLPTAQSLTFTQKVPQTTTYKIELNDRHSNPNAKSKSGTQIGYTNDATPSAELDDSSKLTRSKTDPPKGLKQSKSSKSRTKKEEKKWKKKMKEIGKNHPEFELSYDLLLGIRTSTSTVNSSVIRSSLNPAVDDDDSSDDDDEMFEKEFKDSKRYSFPSSGSSTTPPHHMNDFEFKDYSRPIFAQLREWFGVKPTTYLMKLCGGFNLLEFISNSKSGQFFFYSHDGQFLIKSMTRSECKLMRKILPQYYYYVQNQPNTLLTKFYGMYRVKTHNRQPIYFIVMGSVFHTSLEIHEIYDLKGSTHGRRATDKDKSQETPVLKDLDFMQNDEVLNIGAHKARLFCEQLRRDTELLRKMKIMDYSLLIGIHYANRKAPTTPPIALANEYSASLNQQFDSPTNAPVVAASSGGSDPNMSSNPTSDDEMDSTAYDDDIMPPQRYNKANHTNKRTSHSGDALRPKQSVTESADMESTDDEDKDKDNDEKEDQVGVLRPALHPLSSSGKEKEKEKGHVARLSGGGSSLRPLKRVTSRRISQANLGGHNRYTVKTPLEKNFDMPELLEIVRNRNSSQQSSRRDENHLTRNGMGALSHSGGAVSSSAVREDEHDDDDDEYTNIFATDQGGMQMTDCEGNIGNKIYFCGIIDILQKYNKRKKVENFFRGLNTDTSTISAVPPDQYSQRMYDFLKDRIK